MSVIGKKPFVNYIIDECSVEQANQVVSIMNNLGTPTQVALYGSQNILSEDNKGISYVTLKLQDLTKIILNGILVYLDDTHCGFFGIASNSDNIVEYRINPIDRTFERIYEYLTIEELRQVCGDRLSGEGGGGSGDSYTKDQIDSFLANKIDINNGTAENLTVKGSFDITGDTFGLGKSLFTEEELLKAISDPLDLGEYSVSEDDFYEDVNIRQLLKKGEEVQGECSLTISNNEQYMFFNSSRYGIEFSSLSDAEVYLSGPFGSLCLIYQYTKRTDSWAIVDIDASEFINPFGSSSSSSREIDINDSNCLELAIRSILGIIENPNHYYKYDSNNQVIAYGWNVGSSIFTVSDTLVTKLIDVLQGNTDITKINCYIESSSRSILLITLSDFSISVLNGSTYLECNMKFRRNLKGQLNNPSVSDSEGIYGVIDTSLILKETAGEIEGTETYEMIIDNSLGLFNIIYITEQE